MVNYANSFIYKLCCKNPNITEIYIGSTTNKYRRKQQHKSDCNNENGKMYNRYVYQFIRENGNFENWDFVEIESFNATDKGHLHARERVWIEELKSELNKYIPTRTRKEYRETNKDEMKVYRETNKDVISKRMKEYYQTNKAVISKQMKEYNKEYRAKNKEKQKEYNKKYREANKNKIS